MTMIKTILYLQFVFIVSLIISPIFLKNIFLQQNHVEAYAFIIEAVLFTIFFFKKRYQISLFVSSILLFYSLLSYFMFDSLQVTVTSITIIFLVIYIYLFNLDSNVDPNSKKSVLNLNQDIKLKNFFKEKKYFIFLSYCLFFITILITQNRNLNFELIDWDIHSYLVASQDILRGNLPLEQQWETKGPMMFYLYAIAILITGTNYLNFKLFYDLILLIITVILYMIIAKKSKNRMLSLVSGIFYILLMSLDWATVESSEINALLFISLSYYLFIQKRSSRDLFLAGFCISLGVSVNMGALIFVLPFILSLTSIDDVKSSIQKITTYSFGLLIPQLFFIFLYSAAGELQTYKATLYDLPILYSGESFSFFYELFVFLRSIFEYNIPLYVIILLITIYIIISTSDKYLKQSTSINYIKIDSLNNSLVAASLFFYYLAGHGYYHHLVFLLFFIPISISQIQLVKAQIVIVIILSISFFGITTNSFQDSYNNVVNKDKILKEFPLYGVAQEIDTMFEDEYSVLALDYNLVLYYLDKPNLSYVIHPTNHFEDFLYILIDINKIRENELKNLLLEEPDVILCSSNDIKGKKINYTETFSCSLEELSDKYIQLETDQYTNNLNRSLYNNSNKEVIVFIRMEERA